MVHLWEEMVNLLRVILQMLIFPKMNLNFRLQNMEKEEFNLWSKNIFKAIKEISDLERQKLIWMGKLPNLASSFIEDINVLYDDNEFQLFIEYLKKSNDKLLSDKLDELKKQIDKYDEGEKTEVEILSDPQWIAITEKAKKIINVWNNH